MTLPDFQCCTCFIWKKQMIARYNMITLFYKVEKVSLVQCRGLKQEWLIICYKLSTSYPSAVIILEKLVCR